MGGFAHEMSFGVHELQVLDAKSRNAEVTAFLFMVCQIPIYAPASTRIF